MIGLQTKQFKIGLLKEMFKKQDFKYNQDNKAFDITKFNLDKLVFSFVTGFKIPTIYGIESEDGELTIISNNIFIELFFHCFNNLENKVILDDANSRLNKYYVEICIIYPHLVTEIQLNKFKLHAESFNFDDFYLLDDNLDKAITEKESDNINNEIKTENNG